MDICSSIQEPKLFPESLEADPGSLTDFSMPLSHTEDWVYGCPSLSPTPSLGSPERNIAGIKNDSDEGWLQAIPS